MCHDSQCEETAPLVRKSDFADLGVLAPTDFVKHATSHRRGAVRLAAAGEPWWCEGGGINEKLKDYFEENMQADGVPFLKDYDTYQVSFPVRELGIDPPLKLYQTPVLCQGMRLGWICDKPHQRMQRPRSHTSQRLPILVSRPRWWSYFSSSFCEVLKVGEVFGKCHPST